MLRVHARTHSSERKSPATLSLFLFGITASAWLLAKLRWICCSTAVHVERKRPAALNLAPHVVEATAEDDFTTASTSGPPTPVLHTPVRRYRFVVPDDTLDAEDVSEQPPRTPASPTTPATPFTPARTPRRAITPTRVRQVVPWTCLRLTR